MPRITLTDLAIKNLKPTGKQVRYLCNRSPNFGLVVSQNGGKSFFVTVGPERKQVHLGKYPAVSLAEARKKLSNLTAVPRTTLSYREATDLYLTTYIKPNYRDLPQGFRTKD